MRSILLQTNEKTNRNLDMETSVDGIPNENEVNATEGELDDQLQTLATSND